MNTLLPKLIKPVVDKFDATQLKAVVAQHTGDLRGQVELALGMQAGSGGGGDGENNFGDFGDDSFLGGMVGAMGGMGGAAAAACGVSASR